ncbi:MAG: DUF5074 domain-containing protein [Polaribacter sp.]
MNIKKTFFLAALTVVLLTSCSKDDETKLPKGDFENGILVTNEGAFSGGTGTVNFISDDYKTEEAKIYNKVNNENIGTILQSAGFYEDNAYLIANVGNKISVANRYTMKKETEITGDLSNPRYIAFSNGKGFVTNWGAGSDKTDDFIAVIDLTTNTISTKIPVSEGPEQIIANGNTLYITHKGGFGSGNTVTVINARNNSVIKSINVGDIPDEIIVNNSGEIVVSCEGKAQTQWNPTEVLGSLVTINPTTNEVKSTINYASGFYPAVMTFNSGNFFLSTSSAIYKMSENATQIPTASIISTTVSGLSVNDNKIYVTDVKNFQSNGTLKIYDATTNTELKEFTVGLIPRKIYFN